MGLFHRMVEKGKLRISFVSSTSFTHVQVSKKGAGVVEGTQWLLKR